MDTTRKHLVLNERLYMCSGINCPIRERCYRYRLDRFYDIWARKPHGNPHWVEPSYNKNIKDCTFFQPIVYQK